MPINPENQPIVVRLSMFKDLSLEEARRQVISMEVYPSIDKNLIPPAAWVIGTSLKQIYEGVLGQECPFGGLNADAYIRIVLTKYEKIVPVVVPENTLNQLIEVQGKMKPNEFSAVVQALLQLPLEVSIEK